MTFERMIKKFQCPGCVCGPKPKTCSAFKLSEDVGAQKCSGHVMGTSINGQIHVALGLPTGFCRSPPQDDKKRTRSQLEIGLWLKGTKPLWDHLNVPVWALVQDGHLFVRTYRPRVDRSQIDVIAGGTLAMVPNAIDVKPFYDEID